MKARNIFFLVAVVIASLGSQAQDQAETQPTSTITGTIVDKQSQYTLPGVNVILLGTNPTIGTVTDLNGEFKLENIPVGRQAIQVSFIGYEPQTLSNLLVFSGKALRVDVSLQEQISELKEVVVSAQADKRTTINKMATVSARTLSVEEAQRYSGAFNDPARMAQNFAGVSGASDDRNDIIIRGNSPTGVLWRMEGIDIPSPNHFSAIGTTGGPVSMLNINNLSNSDFFTSAWSAEYGNALSGTFDLQLRNGNNQEREYLGQIGFNGFEFGAEGPFSKNSRASYLFNYRYSTLAVVSALGLDIGTGAAVPQYQDLTFKLNFPTEKAGIFSLWGFGGISYIEFEADTTDTNNLFNEPGTDSRFGSNTGVVGASHKYYFGKNTFSKITMAASGAASIGRGDSIPVGDLAPARLFGFDREQVKYSIHAKVNHKFNAKNTVSAGLMGDLYQIDFQDSARVNGVMRTISTFKGDATLLQSYAQWQHRFDDKWTLNTGVHSQHFLFSNSHIVEPRLGLKYQLSPRHTFSAGVGHHSQLQPINVYFIEERDAAGNPFLPNDNLDFSKSIHNVIGYDFLITDQMRLKTEVYYQYLYNVPVDSASSSFSILNEGANFLVPDQTGIENTGTGYNYGLELTLERFFDHGFYFLFTNSLFDSKYRGSDDVVRNTIFNSNYVANALAGKEFALNTKSSLSFDTKVTYAGGRRFTPIDLATSRAVNQEVLFDDRAFEDQLQAYFRADFKITYRYNGDKVAHQFFIDFQNIANVQNVFQQGYNTNTGEIGTVYQRGFFPDVNYRIYF